jgi:hypothetical protein
MDEIEALNEISELWNLPWHELQRSLAAGFGDSHGACATGVGAYETGISRTAFKPAGTRNPAAPVGSWLVRARSRANTPLSVGRKITAA